MKVEVPNRLSKFYDSPAGFEIIIPAKRNYFYITFLGFWIMGWVVAEVWVIDMLISWNSGTEYSKIFLYSWLGAWTAGGVFSIYFWLWMAIGKEIIILNEMALSIKRDILGFGRTYEYVLNHINNMRYSAPGHTAYDFETGMSIIGIRGGLIAFDYGERTFRFGASIDEVEAKDIILEINRRHQF